MNLPTLVDRARADFIEMPRLPVTRNASAAFPPLTLSSAARRLPGWRIAGQDQPRSGTAIVLH